MIIHIQVVFIMGDQADTRSYPWATTRIAELKEAPVRDNIEQGHGDQSMHITQEDQASPTPVCLGSEARMRHLNAVHIGMSLPHFGSRWGGLCLDLWGGRGPSDALHCA